MLLYHGGILVVVMFLLSVVKAVVGSILTSCRWQVCKSFGDRTVMRESGTCFPAKISRRTQKIMQRIESPCQWRSPAAVASPLVLWTSWEGIVIDSYVNDKERWSKKPRNHCEKEEALFWRSRPRKTRSSSLRHKCIFSSAKGTACVNGGSF